MTAKAWLLINESARLLRWKQWEQWWVNNWKERNKLKQRTSAWPISVCLVGMWAEWRGAKLFAALTRAEAQITGQEDPWIPFNAACFHKTFVSRLCCQAAPHSEDRTVFWQRCSDFPRQILVTLFHLVVKVPVLHEKIHQVQRGLVGGPYWVVQCCLSGFLQGAIKHSTRRVRRSGQHPFCILLRLFQHLNKLR